MNRVIYRPHYEQGYKMLEQICMRHAEDLLSASLEWHEHKDDYGDTFLWTPWVRAEFKGRM